MDPKEVRYDLLLGSDPAAHTAAGSGSAGRLNRSATARLSLALDDMTNVEALPHDMRVNYISNVLSAKSESTARRVNEYLAITLDELLAEGRLLLKVSPLVQGRQALSYHDLPGLSHMHTSDMIDAVGYRTRHIAEYAEIACEIYGFVILPKSTDTSTEKEDTMLEQMLKLYTMFMATGTTSPLPHFVGPPGTGKSTVAKQLADLVGVRLHTVNVSRLSPLELEGVQMPDKNHAMLNLLHSPLWTQLEDGDIVLLDEFLRGFAEVYNGLLDIITAREVAGLKLKKVFFIAASNSVVTYDGALEDRLLHIHVPDPRHNKTEKSRLAFMLIDNIGLNPEVKSSIEMRQLLEQVVLPGYALLDSFAVGGKNSAKVSQSPGATPRNGASVRKLIGQAQLRHVQEPLLAELIEMSNAVSMKPGKHQFVVLMSGKNVPAGYEQHARNLLGNPKLSRVQSLNLELNLQLIEMEKAKSTNNEEYDSDLFIS